MSDLERTASDVHGRDHIVDIRKPEPTVEVVPAANAPSAEEADGRSRRRRRGPRAGVHGGEMGAGTEGSTVPAPGRAPMPWRGLLRAAGEVGLVGVLAAALAWLANEWWRIPFGLSLTYGGDELAGLAHVKGVDETGWWFTNPRLGAPFGLEHYDFPHGGESLQVAAVRSLGVFSDAPAAIMNAYYLATFVLVAVSAHLVLRYLRFAPLLAGTVAMLYSFLPFHFWHHVGHIYRSGYFAAPVGALVLLWLAGYDGGLTLPARRQARVDPTPTDGPVPTDGIAPLDAPAPDGAVIDGTVIDATAIDATAIDAEASGGDEAGERRRLHRGRLAVVLLAVVLIAGTDVVAAAFAPAIAGVVGVLAVLRRRSWRTLGACLLFGIATIGTVVLFNVPTLSYRAENGANPETVQRQLSEQEAFALKISRVVLPSPNHPIEPLRELGELPMVSRIESEGGQALGIVGVVGLILGVAAALPLGAAVERGTSLGGRPDRRQLQQISGLLMILSVLIAVPSGLSYLSAVAGLEEIRTWNRIVVYLGFFALVCAAVGLEGLGDRLRRRNVPPAVLGAGVLVVGAIGFYDQVPGTPFNYDTRIEAWNDDAHFFHLVEESLSADGAADPMVFQLPVVDYPEPGRPHLLAYDHFRGYIHTDDVAWSHGAMRGRPASAWQDHLEQLPSAVALDGLAAAGFDGIYLDSVGYADEGASVRGLIPDAITVSDDRQFYYSLAPRAADLAGRLSPTEQAELAAEILHPVLPEYGDGFHAASSAPSGGVFATDAATLRLVGTLDEDRPVTLGLTIFTAPGGGHQVWIYDGEGDELASVTSSVPGRTIDLEIPLVIPAQGVELRFVTDSPEYSGDGDPRDINIELARLVAVGRAVGATIAAADETGLTPFR